MKHGRETIIVYAGPEDHRPMMEIPRDGNGPTVRHIWAGDMRVATVVNKEPYYYHYDSNGNVVAVTDKAGKVVERRTYDPYGNSQSQGSRRLEEAGYVAAYGVQTDRRTGLQHMGYRDYDSSTGRFISVDPLAKHGYEGAFQRYSYAGGNPINLIDPMGLESTCSPTGKGACIKACMSDGGAGYALAVLGVSAPLASVPKPYGAGSLGSGSWTSGVSLALNAAYRMGFTGTAAVRTVAARLNPVANVAAAGAAGYLAGLAASCALQCSGF